MLIMIVRSHLKYFQSPLFSIFVMCIERGCWLRMHSTQYTINKVSRTNVFYALFAKRNKILLAAYSKYSTFWINIKICHLVINRSSNISYITSKHGDIVFNDTIWDRWYSIMCSRSIYQTRCRYLNKLYIWMLLAAILGSKEQRTRHSTQLFVGHNWIAKCFVAKSSSFVVFRQKDQKDGWSITIYTKISRKMYFIYVPWIKYTNINRKFFISLFILTMEMQIPSTFLL